MNLMDKINETAQFLKDKGITVPAFGLILGSGLGELAGEIENAVSIDYADIPNTFKPEWAATITSGTVDIPTALAPKVWKARISAGVS